MGSPHSKLKTTIKIPTLSSFGEPDLREKSTKEATVRIAFYLQKVARYYNTQVKAKEFRVGDLML